MTIQIETNDCPKGYFSCVVGFEDDVICISFGNCNKFNMKLVIIYLKCFNNIYVKGGAYLYNLLKPYSELKDSSKIEQITLANIITELVENNGEILYNLIKDINKTAFKEGYAEAQFDIRKALGVK